MILLADKVANSRAGKEPLEPIAITSPDFKPACWKYLTISAAKSGLVEVLFASRLPRVVVNSLYSLQSIRSRWDLIAY